MLTDLFAIAHGTLSSDHNFTAGILLDLLGGHAARTEDPTDKVELQQSSIKYIQMSVVLHLHSTIQYSRPTILLTVHTVVSFKSHNVC